MRRGWAALAAAVVLSAPAGCSDDGDGGGGAAAPDVDRWCELRRDYEARVGDELLAAQVLPGDVEAERAAYHKVVDEQSDQLDEMVRVAPAEIRAEVEADVAADRAFAEGDADDEDPRLTAAIGEGELKVREVEQRDCPDLRVPLPDETSTTTTTVAAAST